MKQQHWKHFWSYRVGRWKIWKRSGVQRRQRLCGDSGQFGQPYGRWRLQYRPLDISQFTAGDEWFFSKPGTYAWKISNNIPYFYIYTPSLILVEPSPLNIEQWHHLVATYNQSTQTIAIYIDGQLDTTVLDVGSELNLSTYDHMLGHSSDACLNGILDDVRVYNKALNASEVQVL